ncbi:hypothetical protein [Ferrovum sp.]|uniref:hypothetical protein n=1 Tax=Ferrovum sp. TaxID=2609467 RepID=UPI00260F6D42|nr:hypothetical protein [Ferrovum sp.]
MTQARDADTDIDTPAARKPVLNQRFDFGTYIETKRFLDKLIGLSRRENYYPNLSFGKTYVIVSIDAEGWAALAGRGAEFTREMEALAAPNKV